MDQINDEFARLSIKSNKTGFIYSENMLLHRDVSGKHVEKPERLEEIVKRITEYVNTQKLENVEIIKDVQKCERQTLKLAYQDQYIDFLENLFEPILGETDKKNIEWFSGDTYVNKFTDQAAKIATQSTILALENVAKGVWSNAFAAVRPPGHHSGQQSRPNGFCIYNNIVLGLSYLRQNYNIKKACLLDWDIHHGNGTEQLTYNDENTLFISLHRYDNGKFYPGTGHPQNIGGDQAQGKNINIGWNININENIVPGNFEYIYAFERIIEPVLNDFQPEIIIVSAGFDSAKDDPLGGCGLTNEGFAYMTEKLLKIQSKLVLVLEGGYNIPVTAEAAKTTFRILTGQRLPLEGLGFKSVQKLSQKSVPNRVGIDAVKSTLSHIIPFWPILQSEPLVQYEYTKTQTACHQIAGGHIFAFKIEGDKLYKKAKIDEIEFYQQLTDKNKQFYEENQFLLKHQLIPKFIGIEGDSLIMENLLHNAPHASQIDLKLGIKSYNPQGPELIRQRELKKMGLTSNYDLGFRISGLKIKNKKGEITKNMRAKDFFSERYKNKSVIVDILVEVLKSNQADKINKYALNELINFLQKLSLFIQTVSQRYFRCSSILLIVDNIKDAHHIKWIDFNHNGHLIHDTESPHDSYDKNIMFGINKLLEILDEIKQQEISSN